MRPKLYNGGRLCYQSIATLFAFAADAANLWVWPKASRGGLAVAGSEISAQRAAIVAGVRSGSWRKTPAGFGDVRDSERPRPSLENDGRRRVLARQKQDDRNYVEHLTQSSLPASELRAG